MAGAAVLQEVRALVEVFVDGDAQLVRRHFGEQLSRILRHRVVHFGLEARDIALREQRERHRVRPAPPHDVAGGKDARAGGLAGRDVVAHLRQWDEKAVAVADRRHPVRQVDLRGLEHDLVLARVVLGERLVAIAHAAVERKMDVRVEEARDHPAPGRVDDGGVTGNADVAARSDGADPVAVDHDDRVGDRGTAVAVDQGGASDCHVLCAHGKRRREAGGDPGRQHQVNRSGSSHFLAPPSGSGSYAGQRPGSRRLKSNSVWHVGPRLRATPRRPRRAAGRPQMLPSRGAHIHLGSL